MTIFERILFGAGIIFRALSDLLGRAEFVLMEGFSAEFMDPDEEATEEDM